MFQSCVHMDVVESATHHSSICSQSARLSLSYVPFEIHIHQHSTMSNEVPSGARSHPVSPCAWLTQAHTIHPSPMYLTREIYSNTALCKMRCVSSIQKRGGQPHHPINRCIYTCTILPWVSSWMCVCVVLVSVNTRSMEDVLCQPTCDLFLPSFLGQVCGAAWGWWWWQRGWATSAHGGE